MIADLTGSEILVFTAVGFVLFRIFDIIKPPPIRQLEKLKGAWGVLMDDVLAGVYAQIALQIFWRLGGLDGV
jgi:phosphatidylglycerophosphatase A